MAANPQSCVFLQLERRAAAQQGPARPRFSTDSRALAVASLQVCKFALARHNQAALKPAYQFRDATERDVTNFLNSGGLLGDTTKPCHDVSLFRSCPSSATRTDVIEQGGESREGADRKIRPL
jgi:hypothetical protein